MINNPNEITEILNKLDKITFEQLDKAIKEADKNYEQLQLEYEEQVFGYENEININETNLYNEIESQQIEVLEKTIIKNEKYNIKDEGDNKLWTTEQQVLVA